MSDSKNHPAGFKALAREALGEGDSAGGWAWLHAAIAQYGGLVEKASKEPIEDLQRRLEEKTSSADMGPPLTPDEIAEAALASAQRRGTTSPRLRDYIVAMLEACDVAILEAEPTEAGSASDPAASVASDHGVATVEPATATGEDAPVDPSPAPRKTPTLDKFGRDLTAAARAGDLAPLYGREQEVQTVIEVLCRTAKRNPMLIGPAGSGKTAIAEGLASRIVSGDVPHFLANVRLIAIETSSLVSGTGVVGAFEERMSKIIDEASQPHIILFIDEAHTVMQAGGQSGGLADILKPALARGQLAVMAATTDEEYRRFIKVDRALERRFQAVPIAEMGSEAALEILKLRCGLLKQKRNVDVPVDVLRFLVEFADQNMRTRTFPDKAIDLLEQVVGYASSRQEALVTADMAEDVVSRLVGDTIDPADACERVDRALAGLGVFPDARAETVSRLSATLNRLDRRTFRPNLVMALTGQAAASAPALAEALADALYGDPRRIITVDLSQIRNEEAISILLGSPPGYVGFERPLVIHHLATVPRSVVVINGADSCHQSATEVVARAVAEGCFVDASGGRYYLSDAAVLVAVEGAHQASNSPLGFTPAEDTIEPASLAADRLRDLLGGRLADEIDVVVERLDGADELDYASWIDRALMPSMIELYARRGVELDWDADVVEFLGAKCVTCGSMNEVERRTEELLSQTVLKVLGDIGAGQRRGVRLEVQGDTLVGSATDEGGRRGA